MNHSGYFSTEDESRDCQEAGAHVEMQLPGIKDALWYVRGLGATGKVLVYGQEPLSASAEQRGVNPTSSSSLNRGL